MIGLNGIPFIGVVGSNGDAIPLCTELRFANATVTRDGQAGIVAVVGGGSSIEVQQDGGVTATANTLNFIDPLAITDQGGGVFDVEVSIALGVSDDGVFVLSARALNFIGAGVAVVNNAGTADITIPGLTVEDDGVLVATADTLNFTGIGVSAADAGGGQTNVNIPGIDVEDDAVSIVETTKLNFIGAGVTAVDNGGTADITIPGGGGAGGGGLFGPLDIELVAAFGATLGGTAASTNTDAADRGLSMDMTAGANDNWSLLTKAQVADFVATTRLIVTPGGNAGTPNASFIARDSVGGEFIQVGFEPLLTGISILASRWTNATTFGASIGAAAAVLTYDIFLRFTKAAGVLTFEYSMDGVAWRALANTTEAAQGLTIDEVGLGVKAHTGFPGLICPFFEIV